MLVGKILQCVKINECLEMFCRGWLASLISVSSTSCITSAWLLLAEVAIMEGIMRKINLLCPTISLDPKHICNATTSSPLGYPLHSPIFWWVGKNVQGSLDNGESHHGEVFTSFTSSLCMGVNCGKSPKWLFVGADSSVPPLGATVFSFISCL